MNKLSLFLLLASVASLAISQDQTAADLESEFAAMLKNATLTGSWVPIKNGTAGEKKKDSYEVVRATKVKGDQWEIVTKTQHQGRSVEAPIPVIIKWAGDTAVMILDDVETGEGKSYSARVMFHNHRYAGSWWGENQPGGLLSGAITQSPG